ncbi:MAG: tRNA pseudouridine(38-40) synthase TruA [Thermoplasmata archaeon]|nr:MAG: tRNA pseudouridine(38-40) synthase TruA [Thermoplasmata archaeon]
MRIAIKIGYDGTKFNGFAVQPNKKTVEGEILRILKKTKIIEDRKKARFQYAARTDKGVSAFGNVIAFDAKGNAVEVLKSLEDIWVFGYANVKENFNPRNCIEKIYRYYVYDNGYNYKKLKEALNLFKGEHDFSNFAKLDGRNPVRKINDIKVRKAKNIIKIDFIAKSFLWNQIRRIMASVLKVAKEEIEIEEIKEALEGKKRNFGLAPAKNLVLLDVKYNFGFKNLLPSEIFIKREIFTDALNIHRNK